MRFNWTKSAHFLWISLSPWGAGDVAESLLATLRGQQGWKRLYIDFSGLDRIGAYQLLILARCANYAAQTGRPVYAKGVSPTMMEILEISRLTPLFEDVELATDDLVTPALRRAG